VSNLHQFGRLLHMPPRELRERGAQQLATWGERWQRPMSDETFAAYMSGSRPEWRRKDIDSLASELLAWRRRRIACFFFSRDELLRVAESVRQLFPESVKQSCQRADRTDHGRLDLLGLADIDVGSPPRWHRDPISGHEWPRTFWSAVDLLSSDAPGDSKIIWELNRHLHFPVLGKAYALTGDEKFAKVFAVQLLDWIHNNPPHLGINWTSSLELALRCISWTWAVHLLCDASAYSATVNFALLKSVFQQMRHVATHLSYHFSPNTHLTGEALGLFYVGTLFSELPASEEWRTLGWRILVEESRRQVMADFMHFERSACYLKYTACFYLHAYLLARRNGVSISADFLQRLRGLMQAATCFVFPNGETVKCGDNDGGLLLNLDGQKPDDLRPLLSTGAALFADALLYSRAEELREETLWLLGAEAAPAFWRAGESTTSIRSQGLSQSGFYAFRDSNREDANFLLFNVGTRLPHLVGHAHADELSIAVAADGIPVLVDPGTCSYAVSGDWRNRFRGARSHSVVLVDDSGSSEPASQPFRWKTRAEPHTEKIHLGPELDYAQASVVARFKSFSFLHRRRVVFLKGGFWFVHDWIEGPSERSLEWLFHCAPGRTRVLPGSSATEIHTLEGGRLTVIPVCAGGWELACANGNNKTGEGWCSAEYGLREAAPVLSYKRRTRLPAHMGFVLLPATGVVDTAAWRQAWSSCTLTCSQGASFVYHETTYVLLSNFDTKPLTWKGWSLQGDFALVAEQADGTRRAYGIGLSSLQKDRWKWVAPHGQHDGAMQMDPLTYVNPLAGCVRSQ